jgi:formylglycine-generating enzyme required for sulfatase activity
MISIHFRSETQSAPWHWALCSGGNFQNVKERVLTTIGGVQQPWESNGLGRRVYLTGPPPQSTIPDQSNDASREWSAVDKASIAELETFVQRHGSSTEANYARARLAALKLQQAELAIQAANAAKKKSDDEVRAKSEADRRRFALLQLYAENTRKQTEIADAASLERVFRDCSDCPEMVVVPAGTFVMGSPVDEPGREHYFKGSKDQVTVTIAKPFAVGRHPVTRGEFAAFVAATGHKSDEGCLMPHLDTVWRPQADHNWRSPGFTQNDRHPVVCVSWDDAKAYTAWLSKKTGAVYRLPSEAEREYVARAGTTTPFWWGATISTRQANNGRVSTVAVDTFEPNPFGLYNVHGNVWDLTEDCWNLTNAGNPGDGNARTTGDCQFRVVRGGSWTDPSFDLRSALRIGNRAHGTINRGFRLVRALSP